MENIMIYAYTNFNLGDDLFIRLLCERYPNINFKIYAPKKYRETFRETRNLAVIPNDTLISRVINFTVTALKLNYYPSKLVAKRCDAAVYIGGSIFMQQKNWEVMFKKKKNMKIKNKPYFVLGANFGPFKD